MVSLDEILRPYTLYLIDVEDREIAWMDCSTVEQAREEWCSIAGRHAHQLLSGFKIMRDKTLVYQGSYVTDEC